MKRFLLLIIVIPLCGYSQENLKEKASKAFEEGKYEESAGLFKEKNLN